MKTESGIGVFFTNCSIRGVSKAYKTHSIVVKVLWIVFIIIMSILLFDSIIKIVTEYLEYNTTIQTKLKMEDASLFPAITICPYQPFSYRALKYFKNGGMSPKQFSKKLRNTAKFLIENQKSEHAEEILFYDDMRVYYQNIPYKDAIDIGLNDSEVFVFCITKLRVGMFSGKPDSNCGFQITRYSNPDFFNCYTINVKSDYSKDTEYIHVIIRFTKLEGLRKHREISLLSSLTQDIEGAQLLVHHSDSSPLTTKEIVHVEPNRLVQINYENNQWKEYSNNNDMCKSDENQKIRDLENEYSFTMSQCLAEYNAKAIFKKCGCIMAFLPRSVIPSDEHPYCGNFRNLTSEGFNKFDKQIACVKSVLINLNKMSSADKNCLKNCEEQKFNLRISNINWSPNLWQLDWLFKLQESLNILIETKPTDVRRTVSRNVTMTFLNANTREDLLISDSDSMFYKHEKYACIVLQRLSNETYYREEKLGLSLYGLVSRVGGSCTLYLGLTCAFIIEFVEFLVVIWKDERKKLNYPNVQQTYELKYENNSINNPQIDNEPDYVWKKN